MPSNERARSRGGGAWESLQDCTLSEAEACCVKAVRAQRPEAFAWSLNFGPEIVTRERDVIHASAFAACAAADPGFVHFDVFVRATPDAILVRADHSGAKLMEDLEGCLIARQPELPLKLDGRHALSLAGDQVGSPEPSGQWRVTALHDRADSQSCLPSTAAACQHTRAGRDAKRLTSDATMRTDEAAPQRTFSRYSAQAASPGKSR